MRSDLQVPVVIFLITNFVLFIYTLLVCKLVVKFLNNVMQPWFNEGLRDWQNVFIMNKKWILIKNFAISAWLSLIP